MAGLTTPTYDPAAFARLMGYGAPTPTSPYTGQADYSASLMPNISAPGISIPTDTGGTGMMGSLSDWFENSGILGKKLADGTQVQGWGGLGLGAAQGILGGWLGLQQLGVAKDTLAANKEQFSKNFAAQQKTTNAALSDRQAARVASNPGAYQSVGDYMKTYGI
jgi:hypothetical protein